MSSVPPPPLAAIAVAFFGAVVSSTFAAGVAQALPEIAGGLSTASRDAAWTLTLYDLGQVFGLPLVWILGRGVGRGRAMALAGLGYALASAGVAMAPDLTAVLPLRLVQGLFGGMMPVFMMLMVMSSLRPGQGQAEGLALYALSATIGAGISASLAAGVLQVGGWRVLFWTPAVLGLVYALFASRTLVRETGEAQALRGADWPGYLLLCAGCGALVVALSEGERRFWFDTWWITGLLLAGAAGLAFAIGRLREADAPLIRLSIFAKPTFTWSILVAMVFRGPALLLAAVAPQYLVRLQGYSIAEVGDVLLVMTPATVLAIPAAYVLTRAVDPRAPLTLGLLAFALAGWFCRDLAPHGAADQLRLAAALTGVGQAFVMVPVLRFAVHGVDATLGMSCGLLFNLSRLLGQVLATAGFAHLLAEGEKRYWTRLGEALTDGGAALDERLAALGRPIGQWVADPDATSAAAVAGLARQLSAEAYALALTDGFLVLAWLSLGAVALTWALPGLAAAPLLKLRLLRRAV